jgi:hypothetical protein
MRRLGRPIPELTVSAEERRTLSPGERIGVWQLMSWGWGPRTGRARGPSVLGLAILVGSSVGPPANQRSTRRAESYSLGNLSGGGSRVIHQ